MTTSHKLILVRHSHVDPVADVPASEWTLSEQGRLRCDALAKHVQSYAPHVIVSSSEKKAQETAERVGQTLGVRVETAANLHEHDRQGEPYISNDLFTANIAAFFANPMRLMFGNETAVAAYLRFHGAMKSLLTTYDQQTIAVVTHGTVMALYVARILDVPPFEVWRKLGMPALVVLSLPDEQLVELVEEIR